MAMPAENAESLRTEHRTHYVDARGLKCPVPVMKITVAMQSAVPGDEIQATADCDTFERDVRSYCERHRLILLWIRREHTIWTCRIRC